MRHDSFVHSLLQSVLILLATAVGVVVVFRSLKLPPLLGYLIVGVAIGPHALAWIPDTAAARQLAEIGVVFLMFSIGLEFRLPRLFTMRRIVFGLGHDRGVDVVLRSGDGLLLLHVGQPVMTRTTLALFTKMLLSSRPANVTPRS